jgi:hypothetical protein
MVTDYSAAAWGGGSPDNIFAYAFAFWSEKHLRLEGNPAARL